MKRVFILALALSLVPITVSAKVFHKGERIIHKSSGDVYTFQYDADIGIYGADSGLGDLFIIDDKLYAITDAGFLGIKEASKRVTVSEAEMKATKKKAIEYRKLWKIAEKKHKALYKRYMKLLKKHGKLEAAYEDLRIELDVTSAGLETAAAEIDALKLEIDVQQTSIKQYKNILNIAIGSLKLEKSKLKEKQRELYLMQAYLIMVGVFAAFMFALLIRVLWTSTRKPIELPKVEPPAEKMEIIDISELT